MSKFSDILDKAFENFKIESDIWNEECGYCDDIMNVCNHPLHPDKHARCHQDDCPILHPELLLT